MNKHFNNQPLVSVIMNCFDGETFLKESIQSVINQTYQNWELIFWDNRSKDRSAEIFKKYDDKKFKYFYAEEHTTLYKARNLAIEKSQGDFIAFLDTDDLWEKNKLELQMKYFDNDQTGVVFSNSYILKKKKKIYTKQKLPSGEIFNQLIDNYTVGIVTAVIRKFFYLKLIEKFDERFSIIGDYDLFLRLSKICIFKSIQEPLASARIHGKNLTTIMKEEETREMELWLKENKCNLSDYNLEIVKKKLNYRKFVNSKIDGNYKQCIKMFFKSKVSFLSIKNLIILLMPIFLLKKILWYHQN
jgi:glycosyltransferase involved in cell wall biosynthesis